MRPQTPTLLAALGPIALGCSTPTTPPPQRLESTSQAELSSDPGDSDAIDAYLSGPPSREWTAADDAVIAPRWVGDDDRGSLFLPINRGAFPGVEDYVWAPPDGDCSQARATVRYDWDSVANTVHVLIKGKHLAVDPTVQRTVGVDYFSDPFHSPPPSYEHGVFRYWTIVANATDTGDFYFDANTLELLGSNYDFPTPPANVITVQIPLFSIVVANPFTADADGNAVHEFTTKYDAFTVEDGVFSRLLTTYVPLNLCNSAPLQPNISQLRPYVGAGSKAIWQPPSKALNWRDMLRMGIGMDLQIDPPNVPPPQYGHNEPFGFSSASYMGNVAAVQGGVPNGSHFRVLSVIQSVAPVLDPVPGGNALGCFGWVAEDHHLAANFCQSGGQ